MQHPTKIVNREGGCEASNGCLHQRLVSGHGLSHLDLFSGIGGFALAARWNGLTTRAFVEKDAYAQKVLRKNFEGIPIYDDICKFDGKPYAGTWLLTGGFPCQPFSLAGKRRGASDDRALWPEMCRVIDEAKPCWVLGENVPGIISMELDRVLSDLESLGYSAWPIIVPACALDAQHRRDRVWIVAHSDRNGYLGAERRGDGETNGMAEIIGAEHRAAGQPRGTGDEIRRDAVCEYAQADTLADAASGQDNGRKCGDMANPKGRGESLNAAADARRENVAYADSLGRRTRAGRKNGAQTRNDGETVSDTNGAGMERSADAGNAGGSGADSYELALGLHQGYANWQPEPAVGRVANGIPNRVDRLKGLGNAIVPQVAAQLIRQMRMTTNTVLNNHPAKP